MSLMSAPDCLVVEHPSGDIAVLKINRPEVRNAINLEIRRRLADEVMSFSADPSTRCLIITGSDACFAAGADIAEMADADAVEIMMRNAQRYLRVVADCQKPL